jgi:hypothetical protein
VLHWRNPPGLRITPPSIIVVELWHLRGVRLSLGFLRLKTTHWKPTIKDSGYLALVSRFEEQQCSVQPVLPSAGPQPAPYSRLQ